MTRSCISARPRTCAAGRPAIFSRGRTWPTAAGRGSRTWSTRPPTVEFLQTESEVDAILQEARLIKDIHPPYNSDLKDAKSFPYLEITTRQEFPGVYITRNPQDSRNKLFGPFTSVQGPAGRDERAAEDLQIPHLQPGHQHQGRKTPVFPPVHPVQYQAVYRPLRRPGVQSRLPAQIKDLVKFLQSKRSTVLRD
jgi:excinuclease ABC subunit C